MTEALRRDDVSLLAVGEVQKRDPRGAVRVVLDVCDLGRYAVLVVALEVDQPVRLLVATTDMPSGDLAGVVPTAGLGAGDDQRLLRGGSGQLDEVSDAAAAAARRRWLVLTDSHVIFLVFAAGQLPGEEKMSMRSPGRDGDDRPLGIRTLAEAVPGTPLLAWPVQRVHIGDPNLEH